MFKNAILGCLALVLVIGMNSCGGKKFSAKTKQLMDKRWVYDADASRSTNAISAEKTSGVKGLKEVANLKGDVKTIANFVAGHTLQFYKSKGKLAWQRKSGKSLLSTKRKGWCNWKDKSEAELILVGYNGKGKDATFKVDELSDSKLVLVNETGRKKIYNKK